MFEGLLASVLERYLGNFIRLEGATKDLRVSLLSGTVQLEAISILPDCLAYLGLPLTVVVGTISSLEVRIPWHSLNTQACEIKIFGVNLVVSPKYEADPTTYERRMQKQKRQWLQIDELIEEQQYETGTDEGANEASRSYTNVFLNKIASNLQVHLGSIHIRYEDSLTVPSVCALCRLLDAFEVHCFAVAVCRRCNDRLDRSEIHKF